MNREKNWYEHDDGYSIGTVGAEDEANDAFNDMKTELERILELKPDEDEPGEEAESEFTEELEMFTEKFPWKYVWKLNIRRSGRLILHFTFYIRHSKFRFKITADFRNEMKNR